MSPKRLLFTLAMALLPALAAAQGSGSLAGNVTGNSGPVSGVTVVINEAAVAEITDDNGNYLLSGLPPGTYTVSFSLADNSQEAQVTVEAGRTARLDQTVDWDVSYAETITVYSASRRRERIVEAPAAITVVSEQELSRETSTGQLAEGPRVHPRRRGDAERSLRLQPQHPRLQQLAQPPRAGAHRRPRPDGPVPRPQRVGGDVVPIDDMASVELVRGPSSALYGANAYNGVLMLTTKQPRYSEGGTVQLTAGELSTLRGDVRWSTGLTEATYFKVNGSYTSSDDFYRLAQHRRRVQPLLHCRRGGRPGAQLLQRTRGDAAQAQRGQAVARRRAPGPLLRRRASSPSRAATPTSRAWWCRPASAACRSSSSRPPVGARQLLATRTSTSSPTTTSARRRTRRRWPRAPTWCSTNRTGRSRCRATPTSPAPRAASSAAPPTRKKRSTPATRPAWRRSPTRRRSTTRAPPVTPRSSTRSPPKFKALAAGRYDDSDLHDGQFSPKVALVFAPTSNQTIRFTYNEAFQSPNYSEFFLGRAGAGDLRRSTALAALAALDPRLASVPVLARGNSELEVEEIKTWEVGYSGILGGKAFVTVDYYNSQLTGFVTDLLRGVNPAFSRPGNPYVPPRQPAAGAAGDPHRQHRPRRRPHHGQRQPGHRRLLHQRRRRRHPGHRLRPQLLPQQQLEPARSTTAGSTSSSRTPSWATSSSPTRRATTPAPASATSATASTSRSTSAGSTTSAGRPASSSATSPPTSWSTSAATTRSPSTCASASTSATCWTTSTTSPSAATCSPAGRWAT